MREITFKIEEKQDGLMIRDFLRNFGVSSALLTKLKQDENGISLNGEFAKAIAVLHTSDVLKIRIKNKGKMPEKFICDKVKVAYDDEDILVLNKPPLMPVHESRNHRGDTLANVAAEFICYFSIISLAFLIWFSMLDTLGPPSTSLSFTHFSRLIAS